MKTDISRCYNRDLAGKLFVVGIGPGGKQHRTAAAVAAIDASEIIVGYSKYLELIGDLIGGRQTVSSGMGQELQRCHAAIELAAQGKTVAIISSGDAGVYGMAGLVLELLESQKIDIPVEIVPGVTAANAAAAALGAPLMLDYAVISLSDLLIDWQTIRTRLESVAAADMVTVLYNPRSTKRIHQLDDAVEIFLQHRRPDTPVGVVTAAGCDDQTVVISDLKNVRSVDVGMRSIVIIGNSDTIVVGGKMTTRRGYRI